MKFTKIEDGEYKGSQGIWISYNEFNYGYKCWIVTRFGDELFHANSLSSAKKKIISKYIITDWVDIND